MKKSIIFIVVLSLIILSGNCIKASTAVKGPDFAYPRDVTVKSETGIKQALKTGDDIMLLRSLMDYSIAQTIISQDNAMEVIDKMKSIKNNEKNGITIALLDVILANIYHQLYENKRYIYDNRTSIANDTVTDYTQWDGKRFKSVVEEYITDAMKYKDELQSAPIEKYSEIIEIPNRYTAIYYPTLYDFVAYKAIDLCEANVISSLKMYDDLFAFHKQQRDTACIINTEMNRLKYIGNKLYFDKEYIIELENLYKVMQGSEYSGDILIELLEKNYWNKKDDYGYYEMITDFLARFPQYYNADYLKYFCANIKRKSATVSYDGVVCKNGQLEMSVKTDNVDSLYLEIYKLNEVNENSYYVLEESNSKLIKNIPVKFNGSIPFNQDTTITTTIDDYGCYVINVDFEGGSEKSEEKYYQELVCTDLFLYSTNCGNKLNVWVVNPLTGLPVKDCDIIGMDENKQIISGLGKTDKNGYIAIKNKKIKSIKAVKGDDKYSPNVPLWETVKNQNIANKAIINTDLPVYRQGDIVRWSVVRYKSGYINEIVADEEIKMVLKNANKQVLESKIVKVDKWGRAEGVFTVPEDGIMGDYTLTAETIGDNEAVYGSKSIVVSDYKLPAFFVDVDEIKKDSIGNIVVGGCAKTYSGFPVANGMVDIVVSAEQISELRFIKNQKIEIYTCKTNTDVNGMFEVVLGKEVFETIPVKKIVYKIDVSVTSQSGETRFASSAFSDKYSTIINYNIERDINIDNTVVFEILTTDIGGNEINTNIKYVLQKDGKPIFEDTAHSGRNEVSWSELISGIYDLSFIADNDTVITKVFLYHLNDKKIIPINSILWLPYEKYTANEDKVSIVYGTPLDELNVNCLVYSVDGEISQQWIYAKTGIHVFEVSMPENIDEIKVKLIAVGDYKNAEETITIVRNPRKLDLIVESFRDKLLPGTREKWTIRVHESCDTVYQSAVMLNMYNKALDELRDYNFSIFNTDFYWRVNVYFKSIGYISDRDIEELNYKLNYMDINPPEFETYHHSFVKSHHRPIMLDMKMRSTLNLSKNEVAFGSMDFDGVSEESDERVTENETKTTDDFVYRDMETVSAFFCPMLTTDSLGRMEFSFTVPNANGAWNVVAFAYTKDLLRVLKKYEVTTSKPIMVQSNVPRFLRGGDKTEIKASVMNNTDSAVVAETVIELFDVATGKVLKQKEVENEILPMSSVVAGIEIEAPQDEVMIGYRIKSSIAKYADGEQTAITILPSVTPVVESKSFYMSPNDAVCNLTLPAIKGNDARATLQYCENPIWYCVTALPGLRINKNNTSISAMSAIFSAAVAEYIVRKNQDIASALYHWGESEDSTLMSMLDRNEDLKIALLNATPWVMDAKDDTDRMTRLALLFDNKEIKNTYSENINKLSKLKSSDGGFNWLAESRYSSLWATMKIVELYGRMMQLGCTPENNELKTLIDGAVKYLDNQYVEIYRRNNYNHRVPLDYVYIRMMYPEIRKSSVVNSIIEKSVQGIIADWRNYTMIEKAKSAIILEQMNYHATAITLLKSIEEYAIYAPTRGMYWYGINVEDVSLILNAFYQISPESDNIEKIRQWLILQKESQNWGESTTTSDIIASMLATADKRVQKTGYHSDIKIGKAEIMPSVIDKTLGYFRIDVSSMLKTKEDLSIVRPVGQPSWGSVMYQYVDEIKDVEAVGGDGISITKNMYVRELTDKGEVWLKTTSYKVGDIVKIQLTFKVDKSIDYVMVKDERAACFEPVEQMPQPKAVDGIMFYQEVRDDCNNFFVDRLPKGTYIIDYNVVVNNVGEFSSGIATAQSQYVPSMVAHSAGSVLTVDN